MRDAALHDANWMTDDGFFDRRLNVFRTRKPGLTDEWKHKLPDFVLRLEEAVYRGARSKVRISICDKRERRARHRRALFTEFGFGLERHELVTNELTFLLFNTIQEEYCDQATLEARLQAVARIMIAKQAGRPGGAGGPAHQQIGVLFGNGNVQRTMQRPAAAIPPQQQMIGSNGLLPNGAPILRGAAAAQGSQYMGASSQMMAGVPPGTMIPTPGAGGTGVAAAQAAQKNANPAPAAAAKGKGKAAAKPKKLTKAQQAAMAAQQAKMMQQAKLVQQAKLAQLRGLTGADGQPLTPEQIRRMYIVKQQRWLMALRHAAKCPLPPEQCPDEGCDVAKQLWRHVLRCTKDGCDYPRCDISRSILKHHQYCKEPKCEICAPVRTEMLKQRHAAQAQMGRANKRMKLDDDANKGQLMVKGSSGLNSQRKPGGEGTSLMECFTPEEIRTHLAALRLADKEKVPGQGQVSARQLQKEADRAVANATESACRACGVERLTFEPPPLYCFSCVGRIKRGQVFHHVPTTSGEARRDAWCNPCFNAIQGFVEVEGQRFPKQSLVKKKNDDDLEEPWVQCDYCNDWYHQICVLFNGRRNEGGEAPFTCPSCILSQLDKGERKVTEERPSSQQPASSLPKTKMSTFLEERLAEKLSTEREERAKQLGVPIENVPTAEHLTIRVVSQTMKQMDTKSHYLTHFKDQGIPAHFPYRSRVILLFQKHEAADVCLMAIYVQEYDEDCPEPNRRRVYLSYLDSVKYFRPDNVTVATGENYALRTYVYHNILIAYLDFVKQRGFTSCFIWACPPFQGDDYILYCHPKVQKTPKADKLREWYLKMLRSAQNDKIVLSTSNVYDEFRLGNQNHDIRCATEYPYFDGDYFSGVVEDWIPSILKELEEAKKAEAKAKASNIKISARKAAKAKAGTISADAELNKEVMKKLGSTISNMRHDFILAHLAHQCLSCRKYIAGAKRYFATEGTPLVLCEECKEFEDALPVNEKRFAGRTLQSEKCEALPTVDKEEKEAEETLASEFFDTRQAFLSLCQGNHFQFDSLRRAKHTTMMVLYHLNNPSEPAFVASCNVCSRELEPGKGWRCDTCPDFDICDSCRVRVGHQHALQRQGRTIGDRTALSQAERESRAAQIQRTMELLVHACSCREKQCDNSNCPKLKTLLQHAFTCQIKNAGGCQLCRKTWTLLQIHSKQCMDDNCKVPKCKDLKAYQRRHQEQIEERRREHYRLYMNSNR